MNDIATQYRIIAAGAGWAAKTARGRLRFDGADAGAFLQALLSNEIAALAPGAGTYALYLTPQGRMIADLHVFVRTDGLVADVPAAGAPALAEALDQLIFTEDIRISDQSRAIRQFTVVGGRAAQVLSRALGIAVDALSELPLWSQQDLAGGRSQQDVEGGFVVRTDAADEGSWDVLVGEREANGVIAALEQAGAVPAPDAVLEAMRIDAGRPTFGVDMTDETIPLEAGLLDRAISQTKGCYVGQEVIIRVLHRGGGRVAKRLVRIMCDNGDAGGVGGGAAIVPVAGAALVVDGAEVGHVTSAAFSARAGRVVALGYVQRDAAEAGRKVVVSWPGGRSDGVITGPAT